MRSLIGRIFQLIKWIIIWLPITLKVNLDEGELQFVAANAVTSFGTLPYSAVDTYFLYVRRLIYCARNR